LPPGASVVSSEVQGEPSKPALGVDGTRIPLLRPGFRPNGPYTVSFVYVQDGQSFAKKGRAEFELPKMDVPVTLVEWEMFVPDKYRLRRFDGNAMPMPPAAAPGGVVEGIVGALVTPGQAVDRFGGNLRAPSSLAAGTAGGTGGGVYRAQSGQVFGVVTDSSGTVLPGVTVRAMRGDVVVSESMTDGSGWFLLSNVPSRAITIESTLPGFQIGRANLSFDATNARRVDFQLPVGPASESLAVVAETEASGRLTAQVPMPPASSPSPDARAREEYAQAPSSNVLNLQRRIAGVLPVRVDVPRAGAAYKFVRPLVLDETTRVSFEYRPR
jgi:carboxypeptidase family protein